jgi:hypothetical protein
MSETTDLPPPLDDKEFNDPTAWGFCDFCAFEVAIFEGLRVEHRRYRNGAVEDRCCGSGQPPVSPTPMEAEARQIVKLRKDYARQKERAYWQRLRYNARRTARERARLKREEQAREAKLYVVSTEE